MLNLSLEDLASNHPLLWLSQLLPAVVVDSLDPSLNRSNSNSNCSHSNNQQVVYSDHNQNLRGRDCLGQRPLASRNSYRDNKEEEDCLGRIQGRGRGRQVLEEGCLDQCSSSNSPKLEVDCLEVRRGQGGRWGRVREDCLDSSQNLREGCLEVLLGLRLAVVVDFLDRLCNNPNNSRSNSNNNRVSLDRLRSLLRREGCLDQQLNNRSSNSSSSSCSSKVEGCLGILDSHKPSLRVVCLALAHLVLHNNSNHSYNSNRKAACSDPLLGSLRIRLASFSNPRLFSRVCSRACLV